MAGVYVEDGHGWQGGMHAMYTTPPPLQHTVGQYLFKLENKLDFLKSVTEEERENSADKICQSVSPRIQSL